MKSHAVIFTRPNVVEFRQVDSPDPGPDDVVVRVTHSWISNGTEGSYLRGERIGGDRAYRPGDPIQSIVPGYQKVGVVESVGAKISDLTVGQTVFCALGQVLRMSKPIAGHISPSVAKRDQIWPLPPGKDPLAFAGMVLTQVGYNCGTRAPIERGEHTLVLGDGQVGQWTAQTLAWRGANVVMVGRRPERLALAERLIARSPRSEDVSSRTVLREGSRDSQASSGPEIPREYARDDTAAENRNARQTSFHAINSRETSWEPAARALAPDGFAVAVDTVGSPSATEAFMTMLRHSGHIVSAGFCGTADEISLQNLRLRELSLDSVSGWSRPRMDQTLKLIAEGHLQTLPLITRHFPAKEAAEAWRLIRSREANVIGVILDW